MFELAVGQIFIIIAIGFVFTMVIGIMIDIGTTAEDEKTLVGQAIEHVIIVIKK